MVLNHVEAGRCRRQAGDPVHPNHSPALRREREGMEQAPRAAMVSLHSLAGLAGVNILGDIDILSNPESEAAHQ